MLNNRLNAALILASVAGLEMAAQAMPAPRKGVNRHYYKPPSEPAQNTLLQQEIAAHNRAVDERKAAKALAKAQRRASDVRKAQP